MGGGGKMLQHPVFPARRHNVRVETPESVWVYWRFEGHEDTVQVRNLSLGGLFIRTRNQIAVGAKTQLEFLVQEGHIRADAVVEHINPGRGAGLKFMAVKNEDRPRLTALLSRLNRSS